MWAVGSKVPAGPALGVVNSRPAQVAQRPAATVCRTAGVLSAAAASQRWPSSSVAALQGSPTNASTSRRAFYGGQRASQWCGAAAASSEPSDSSDTMQADLSDSDEAAYFESEEEATLGDLNLEYIEYCRERFEVDGLIEIGLGINDLPAVFLHHPNGSELEVYLHGANVTSWRKPDGSEILFVQPNNSFDGMNPIQGGIPVAFPQYGRGALPTNGILRRLHWSIADTGVSDDSIAIDPAPSVALFAESNEETLAIWPHKFEAMYTISLMEHDDFEDPTEPNPVPEMPQTEAEIRTAAFSTPGSDSAGDITSEAVDDDPLQLRCVLEILNADEEPFTFTSALQTHFAIKPLGEVPDNSRFVKLLGLGGKYVLDYSANPSRPRLDRLDDDYVYFGDAPVDNLYVDTEDTDVKLCPGDRTHHAIINRRGFRDTGAVNPHLRMPDAYKHFVSVPSASVARPITLQPGESWVGEMVIRSYDTMWERPLFDFNTEGVSSEPPPPQAEYMR